jgi:hypothetical protein
MNDPKLRYKNKPFPFVDPGEAPRIDVNPWRWRFHSWAGRRLLFWPGTASG